MTLPFQIHTGVMIVWVKQAGRIELLNRVETPAGLNLSISKVNPQPQHFPRNKVDMEVAGSST